MDKIKKLWKELSIFCIVVVAFGGLFAYKNIMFADYVTLSESKLEQMMEEEDSFVVVVGSSIDSSTISYTDAMDLFVNENRSDTLYFVDLSSVSDATTFFAEYFDTDSTTMPQTFKITEGEIESVREGELSYYRLCEFFY
ncbi:hypothetical protein [Tannockella kyphosi]|uniref:hypothetical protein n=1 Tax=Tannockella kyphosi TaxID=2899121 RepID=UPI0020128B50|nr:hypothetical protein [Tannockella kyphosi]